ALARRPRAGGRGARDGRRVHAPDRVPRHRDRRGRATDRASRARVRPDPAADERARRQRDRRRQLPRRDRRHRPLREPAQARRLPRPRSRVRQSGCGPATHGHISKQGSVRARHALVEACWTTVRQPGPLHAFYARVRARRGHSVAIVAGARKLACLFWCLLTRETDYAYAQPSLTKTKLRRLQLTAGAQRHAPEGAGIWHANDAVRRAERELARQAEVAYQRTVRDYHATQANKTGASATPRRAPQGRQSGKQRGKAS